LSVDLVPVPSVLLDRLAAFGIDVAAVLRHAGLLPSRFQPPKARLTTREFFAFWRAVEEASDARDLGLRLGSEGRPHQLNVASFAALHSPNLGEALQKLARRRAPADVRRRRRFRFRALARSWRYGQAARSAANRADPPAIRRGDAGASLRVQGSI
jgi:hypothetical protein